MSQLTFGSLFAGIGGFDLGFERAGMKCVWQVEKDDYARRVLEKHWPDVRRHDDVCTFPPEPASDWTCDVICGGFPCQDISVSGRGAGIDGDRSGLWREFARIIGVLRPRYAVVENVPALFVRGIDRVLGDLASLRYDAEWSIVSACAMGASHTRGRVFIVAYPDQSLLRTSGAGEAQARPAMERRHEVGKAGRMAPWWRVESEPCSVAYGVPSVVDELRPYGNAVVPQVAEYIGRRLVESASGILCNRNPCHG